MSFECHHPDLATNTNEWLPLREPRISGSELALIVAGADIELADPKSILSYDFADATEQYSLAFRTPLTAIDGLKTFLLAAAADSFEFRGAFTGDALWTGQFAPGFRRRFVWRQVGMLYEYVVEIRRTVNP